MLERLGVAEIIDEVVGSRRQDAAASVGTYIALTTTNRVVDPCSKRKFADWWKTTAGDRFVRLPASALDHRRFWDAMDAISEEHLTQIERRIVTRMVEVFSGGGLDLVQLNAALAAVRHLPRLGGAVGRALCLLARGGCDASTEETIAALEVLRRAPGLRALPGVRASASWL